MSDSKKSPEKKAILGKIIPSIDEINSIDVDDSEDKNKENNKRNNKKAIGKGNVKDSGKGNEKKYFEEGLPLNSKVSEFIYNDFNKKFSLLVMAGLLLGVILIIFGISLMLGDAEKVVDHVASGETGSSSIFVIILGAIILGISILKFFRNAGSVSNVLGNLDDLALLDESTYDDKDSDENQLNKDQLDQVDSSSNKSSDDLEEILKNFNDEHHEIIVEHDNTENLEETKEEEDSNQDPLEIIVEHEEIIVEHNKPEDLDKTDEQKNPHEETNEPKDSNQEKPETIVEPDESDDFSEKNKLEEKEVMNSNINKKTSTRDCRDTFNTDYISFNDDFDSDNENPNKEVTLFDFY